MLSLLSHVFDTERHRAKTGTQGHKTPLLSEVDLSASDCNLFATNPDGEFVPTRIGKAGFSRTAYFPCAVDQEGTVAAALYAALVEHGFTAPSVSEATQAMRRAGVRPKVLLSNDPELANLADLVVLRAPISKGSLLFGPSSVTGHYLRVRDHVAVLACNAGIAILAVLP